MVIDAKHQTPNPKQIPMNKAQDSKRLTPREGIVWVIGILDFEFV
jgi:hypothetical protein